MPKRSTPLHSVLIMMLSLASATLLMGVLLLLPGIGYLMATPMWMGWVRGFGRSQSAALITVGLGGAGFLWKVWNLSQADFGDYRLHLFIFFGVVLLGSFWFVRDFLAVRGLCILILVGALELLKPAYAEYELPQRLLMVSAVYVSIVLALFLGTVPFYWRNFHDWLYRTGSPLRSRVLGGILAGYGALLIATAFTY